MEERKLFVEPGETGTIPLSHSGALVLSGDPGQPDLRHHLDAEMHHATDRPLMHMVCWDTEPCPVSVTGEIGVTGEVALVGHADRPIRHEIVGEHHQVLRVEPVDHSVRMKTRLDEPVHHALQMRTPLQLRFCNPWHVVSDYQMDIKLWDSRVISVRLTGATVATPQPCESEDCPPANPGPLHP